MEIISSKNVSVIEFVKKQNINLQLILRFSEHLIMFNGVDFDNISTQILLNVEDKNKDTAYSIILKNIDNETVIDNFIDQSLNELFQRIDEIVEDYKYKIKDSRSRFSNSFFFARTEKFKKRKENLLTIEKHIENYQEARKDEKRIKPLKQRLKNEFLEIANKEITIPDVDLKVGSSVWLLQDNLNLHRQEDNFKDIFSIVEYKVSRNFTHSFSSNDLNKIEQFFDFYAEVGNTELEKYYGSVSFSFKKYKNNFNLTQGVSSYRKFLSKQHAENYREDIKSALNAK